MNLPRYANPHFIAQATRLVSRAELHGEEDAIMEDDEVLQAQLHDALLKRLREDTDSQPRKKRRKVEDIVEDSSVVGMFFISSMRILILILSGRISFSIKYPQKVGSGT